MKKRVISGFFIVLILAIAIFFGKTIFNILIGLCSLFGMYEFINVRKDNKVKKLDAITFISYLSLLLITFNGVFYNLDMISLFIISLLLLTIPIVIYNKSEKYNINDALYLYGAVCMLGIACNSLIMFREESISMCIYIFIISFMTDTYAYIGGMLIGKHKLTTISPKKTIEGSIVGTVMATVIGTCFYDILIGNYSLALIVIVSLALSIISQFGDLFFSSIKRYYDKKDYSNLIPGHGGILDRIDSVIFVTLLLRLIVSIF